MQVVKSPFINRKPIQPKPGLLNVTDLIKKISELENSLMDIEVFKEELKTEHQRNQEQFKKEHLNKLDEVQGKLDNYIKVFGQILEGKVEDVNATLQEVLKKEPVVGVHFKQPENGKSPMIDETRIAKMAANFIVVPKPKDGTPGKDAVIDHDEIVNKVVDVLTKKKKLSIKHLGDFTDGLEQTMRPIRSMMAGFRGGGDVVTAGSNITITTDSNGKKVITGAAGSGFTELSATEIPDSSITVFTFALASAQPSYIVSDNVWQKATSKAGTVNWTWNAGTKKATMTIAPQDDIYAIV